LERETAWAAAVPEAGLNRFGIRTAQLSWSLPDCYSRCEHRNNVTLKKPCCHQQMEWGDVKNTIIHQAIQVTTWDRSSSWVQRGVSAADKRYWVIFLPWSLSGDGHEQQ